MIALASTREIIGVSVSLLVAAILLPIAIGEIVAANTTGWNTAVQTIFQTVLVVLAVIGIAIKYIPRGR